MWRVGEGIAKDGSKIFVLSGWKNEMVYSAGKTGHSTNAIKSLKLERHLDRDVYLGVPYIHNLRTTFYSFDFKFG